MRIDRLLVRNFRGFEERAFDFRRPYDAPGKGSGSFHLLIGQNATGKTSALDALAVAAGSWFLGIRGAESRHIQPEDARIKILQFGDTERIEQQFPVIVEANGRILESDLYWRRELRQLSRSRTTWIHARNVKDLAEQTVQKMQAGVPVTLPLISYYGTGRLWQEPRDARSPQYGSSGNGARRGTARPGDEQDLAEEFASRLAGYHHSIDPRCSPRELLRWLKFEQQLAVQEGRESSQYQVVKEAIRQTVEGCRRVEYHLRMGLVLEIDGQSRLPFGVLSDGQRNIVAMIGDLAFKAAQLNPHLGMDAIRETPGIVLIDEIDLHLHPVWQRHIVEDLRRLFPQVQFIATTHSPFIIQAMRDGELMPLDAQPVPETANLGIEKIAKGLMRVEHPEVSERYREMVQVARDYLETLEEARMAPEERLALFEQRLAQAIAPYADNPAYQAFLEMKRVAALGE